MLFWPLLNIYFECDLIFLCYEFSFYICLFIEVFLRSGVPKIKEDSYCGTKSLRVCGFNILGSIYSECYYGYVKYYWRDILSNLRF